MNNSPIGKGDDYDAAWDPEVRPEEDHRNREEDRDHEDRAGEGAHFFERAVREAALVEIEEPADDKLQHDG